MIVASGEGENTYVIIHGIETLDNFEVVSHMGKIVFVDNLRVELIGVLAVVDEGDAMVFISSILNIVSHIL